MREIVIPILNEDYKAIFTWGTEEEVKKVLLKWSYPLESIETIHFKYNKGICFWYTHCHPVMAMPNLPKSIEDAATVAHEAVHAVEHIFDMIDEDGCNEVFAHSVSSIVEKVLIAAEDIRIKEKKAASKKKAKEKNK